MNLVSLILQFLTPTIINKLSSSLGLGQGIAGKAIAAAIPAILAGLAGTASKPGGATSLSNAVAKQDGGLLGNFANMLGGGQQSMLDNGSNILSSLLGGSQTGALAGALGKFTGMNDGQSKSLLGALAPVVLGTLAKEQKVNGLDAGGLANLLMGQKENIASAMPAGFSNLLQGSGLLDSLGGAVNRPAAHTTTAAPAARTVEVSEPASSGMGILKYLIPLALAAGLVYMLAGRGADHSDVKTVAPVKVEKPAPAAAAPAEKAAAPAEKAAAPAVPAVPGVDLAGQANGAIEALKNALAGVKDEASAKSALPKLQDIAAQIEKLKGTAMALPADARHPLVVMISGVMPGLASMIDKALAMPGVGTVLKPILDQIADNLGAIAKG